MDYPYALYKSAAVSRLALLIMESVRAYVGSTAKTFINCFKKSYLLYYVCVLPVNCEPQGYLVS